MPLAPSSKLGPYEILAALGAGGMGEVYRARDPRLDREVAIKVLPAGSAGDSKRMRRFEQEARATAAFSHPNILAVIDIGSQDNSPYIVSELLEGETLRARLISGPLPVRKAVDDALQTARGIIAAHNHGSGEKGNVPAPAQRHPCHDGRRQNRSNICAEVEDARSR